jgi:hypothetical protein
MIMALNLATLTASIKAGLDAGGGATSGPGAVLSLAMAQGIATGIITEFQTNAVVPGTGLVAPAGGGPVTGAALVT